MDGGARNGPGLQPLVPPSQAADPVALHQDGVDLIAAANLLALSWLREATAQHAAVTRRALAGMTTAAQSLPAAEDAADQARIILAALARAQESGLGAARAISGLMQRIQAGSVALLGQALPKP